MPDIKLSPPTPLPLDVFVVPGSHFDLGWVLHADGSLALGDHIIHEAIELIRGERPELRFTIEYVLFARHFLETFPEHKPIVQEMLRDGRLEICASTTGMMEQILDGETLVRQLTHGIRWCERELGYRPICSQHTDLPGHTIQMPQILAKCGIPYVSYSRYRPPCPLHWWAAPDGTKVLACNHIQHYEWGRVLRKDLALAEASLLDYLKGPFREVWPSRQVLMPEERDLDWVEPQVCDTIKAWNDAHSDVATLRFTILRAFFEAVETDRLPIYRGEAPYGFYSIPTFEPQTYQQCRLAENAILAAERFAACRELEGLGTIAPERLNAPWEHLFWPHDHNIAGQDGPINDIVRTHRATHARVMGESILREVETSLLIHSDSRPELGKAFLVLNPLSWRRSGVVELLMELPVKELEAVEVVDADGQPVPSQLLEVEAAEEDRVDYQLDDPELAECQARIALVARDVPATGYSAFYVRPAGEPVPSRAAATEELLENDHWRIELAEKKITSVTCKRTGRRIAGPGFFECVALEDLRGNLEDGYDPWDPRDNPPNYTGRQWTTEIESMHLLEEGPVRTCVAMYGRLMDDCVITQEIEVCDDLPDLKLRVDVWWPGEKCRQVRLKLPFALNDPAITYETPFGSVIFGRDEMENTYRGDGTRWVQKWVDLSEPDFGVTMSAGCCAINFDGATVSPLLVQTTYCRGDAYYWTLNEGWHRFEFRLRTHDGDFRVNRDYGIGWEQWSPLRVVRSQPRVVSVPHRRRLPDRREYLRCDHPGVVVSAFKRSEGGESCVLRLFNVTDQRVAAEVATAFTITAAQLCDMNEQAQSTAKHGDHTLPLELGPFEIAVYRLSLVST